MQPIPVAADVRGDGSLSYSGADVLLTGPAGAWPAPTVLARHPVTAVRLAGDRVIGVRAIDLTGQRKVDFDAHTVVLAAGAVGTPKIMFSSGLTQWALGRFATDHPMFAARLELSESLSGAVPHDDPPVGIWIPFGRRRRRHVQIVRAPRFDAVDTDSGGDRTVDIVSSTAMEPDPENRLTFSDHETDAFDLPRAQLRLRLSTSDERELAAAVSEQVMLLMRLGRPALGWSPALASAGAAFHLMGTHRLGSSPEDSVADAGGRVWGVAGLHVAGNGELSEYRACNPTLTTVACALFCADGIRAA